MQKLNDLVWPNVAILSFDEQAAQVHGRLRYELEKAGTPLSEPDTRIASITLANNVTLITANPKHFKRIKELKIENWLKE